ncbi:MAG TPA: cysteine hydrolase family protein [Roseiflexaceae bacterium]|nr:cysteine hydrolase family protein [Roseiflexaceae bacterium]
MAQHTALLVIDVQNGMFAEDDPVYLGNSLLATIGDLISKARAADVPVIYVQHHGGPGHPLQPGSDAWRIHPAIAPVEGELIVGKREPDAFFETTLQQELASRNIRKLIITGIQTELCVDTTCRRAASLDYEIILVADGHSTWDSRTLSAAQIIAHHNDTLKGWFATPKPAIEIAF